MTMFWRDRVQLVPWVFAGMPTIMLQVSSGVVLRWTVVSKCDVESIKSFKDFEGEADCAFWTCWPVAVPVAGALLGSC